MLVRAVIEIRQGSKNKYEVDVRTGAILLDRVLYVAAHYPAHYGFVPDTWGEGDELLDILVYGSTAIHPAVEVSVRLLGALMMEDEHGPDAKLIGVVDADPRMSDITALEGLGRHRLQELRQFFQKYKLLQGLRVTLGNYQEVGVAEGILKDAVDRWHARDGGRVHGEV